MTTLVYPTIALAIAHARRTTTTAPLTWNPVDHLLSRFTFGPTPAQRDYVTRYGPDLWYRTQVAAAAKYPLYSGSTAVAARGPLLSMSPFEVRQYLKAQGNEYGWDAMDQLGEVTLGLQAWSAAQLYETLVDFFSNHLNVPNHNGDVWNTRHSYDRNVIRAHVTGTFTDMLIASSKHPAMLTYLNLAESTKIAVNENYGRELLELHTVGLHYTENDVKTAARALTGRTLDNYQSYAYDPDIHFVGPVRVVGYYNANSSAAGGEKVGDDVLRYLAGHIFTAQNLARKLCLRYVSDSPSAALINEVANAYRSHGTQILPMVSTILRSTEFWESRGRKVRRPTENVMATVRTLGLTPTDTGKALDTLNWMTANIGHRPLDWSAPNGYPDVATAWRSSGTLLNLWNLHLGFAGGWWDGISKPNVAALYAGANTSGAAVSLMASKLTGTAWTATHLAALQTFLGEAASTPIARSRLQWLAYPLAALILDAPHHALR